MNELWQFFAIAVGVLIGRELLILGFKVISGGPDYNPYLMRDRYKIEDMDNEIKALQKELHEIKKLLIRIALKVGIQNNELEKLL